MLSPLQIERVLRTWNLPNFSFAKLLSTSHRPNARIATRSVAVTDPPFLRMAFRRSEFDDGNGDDDRESMGGEVITVNEVGEGLFGASRTSSTSTAGEWSKIMHVSYEVPLISSVMYARRNSCRGALVALQCSSFVSEDDLTLTKSRPSMLLHQ